MLHVFFGHEDRALAGTHVFVQSVLQHARQPVALTPITRLACLDQPEGTNAFTFRRFLVPWMMRWKGLALFVDGSDMLVRADVNEILAHRNLSMAVQVVKHHYRTRHRRKYLGSPMEADNADYERKQWASVMLINCSHFAWRKVDPEFVRKAAPMDLLQLRFLPDARIGSLPLEWNWLVDEFGENNDARLLHWTAGVPGFSAHAAAPMSDCWHQARQAVVSCTGMPS